MIKTLKVRDLFNYSFDMHMKGHPKRENHIMRVKGEELFSTYQITGDTDYTKVITVFGVLKYLHKPNFKIFCKSFITTTVSISLDFFTFDEDTSEYTPSSYTVMFNQDGIIEETIGGQAVLDEVRKFDPYNSHMPAHFVDYFELMLVYDLADPMHVQELKLVFYEALLLNPFKRFVLNILEIGRYSPVNIFRSDELYQGNDDEEVLVKYSDGSLVRLEDEEEPFIALALISWVLYISFIKSGVVVLHNIDYSLDYTTICKLLEMFHDAEKINLNKAQCIFSAKGDDFLMYPEQLMEVIDGDKLRCAWQNF